jgi:hypothetical protein
MALFLALLVLALPLRTVFTASPGANGLQTNPVKHNHKPQVILPMHLDQPLIQMGKQVWSMRGHNHRIQKILYQYLNMM